MSRVPPGMASGTPTQPQPIDEAAPPSPREDDSDDGADVKPLAASAAAVTTAEEIPANTAADLIDFAVSENPSSMLTKLPDPSSSGSLADMPEIPHEGQVGSTMMGHLNIGMAFGPASDVSARLQAQTSSPSQGPQVCAGDTDEPSELPGVQASCPTPAASLLGVAESDVTLLDLDAVTALPTPAADAITIVKPRSQRAASPGEMLAASTSPVRSPMRHTPVTDSEFDLLGEVSSPVPDEKTGTHLLDLETEDSEFDRSSAAPAPVDEGNLTHIDSFMSTAPPSESGTTTGVVQGLAAPAPQTGLVAAHSRQGSMEDVPAEPPPILPAATTMTTPMVVGLRSDRDTGLASPQSPAASPGAMLAAPILSAASSSSSARSGKYARAEAFLRRPVAVITPLDTSKPVLDQVQELMRRRSVDAALQLLNGKEVPSSRQVSLLRFRCLVALRQYSAARDAAGAFTAAAEPVPFEVRTFSAQLPYLLSSSEVLATLGNLYTLAQEVCSAPPPPKQTAESGATSDVATLAERLQLLQALSHVAIAAGHAEVASREIGKAISRWGSQPHVERLHSMLGRHYAASGETALAASAFSLAHSCLPKDSASVQLDMGLLAVAGGKYPEAKTRFAAATDALRCETPSELSVQEVDEAVSAHNNLAVCRLYCKELLAGVEGLEVLVRTDPTAYLKPSIIRNLSSLYEFLPDAVGKRQALQEVALAYNIEDIDPKAFAAPNS